MEEQNKNGASEKEQILSHEVLLKTIDTLQKTTELYAQLNDTLKQQLDEKQKQLDEKSSFRSIHQWFRSRMKNPQSFEAQESNSLVESSEVHPEEEVNNTIKIEPTLASIQSNEPKYIQVETKPEYRTYFPENEQKPILSESNPYINLNTKDSNEENTQRKEEIYNKFFSIGQKVKAKLNNFKGLMAEIIPHIDNNYHLETNQVAEPQVQAQATEVKDEEKKPSKLASLVYKLGFKLGQITQKQKDVLPLVQNASMAFMAKSKSSLLSLESAKGYFMFKGHKKSVVQAYKNAKDYFDVLGIKAEDLYKNDNSYLNNLKDITKLGSETHKKLLDIGFDKEDMAQGILSYKDFENEAPKARDEILEKMVVSQLSNEISKIFAFKQEIYHMKNNDPYIAKLKQVAQEADMSYHSLAVVLRGNENLFKAKIKDSSFLVANKDKVIDAMDKYEIVGNSVDILEGAYLQAIASLKESMTKEAQKRIDNMSFKVGNKEVKFSELLKQGESSSIGVNIARIRERKAQSEALKATNTNTTATKMSM
jgi:hypothetical protein